MNCRPNDLARVFRVTPGWEWAMDRIVRVTTPFRLDGDMCWMLAEPVRSPDGGTQYRFACDCCLKPIRDPGDAARDESWDWTPPVPAREDHAA